MEVEGVGANDLNPVFQGSLFESFDKKLSKVDLNKSHQRVYSSSLMLKLLNTFQKVM